MNTHPRYALALGCFAVSCLAAGPIAPSTAHATAPGDLWGSHDAGSGVADAGAPCPWYEVWITDAGPFVAETDGYVLIPYQLDPWDDPEVDVVAASTFTVTDAAGATVPGVLSEGPAEGLLAWRADASMAPGAYVMDLFVDADMLNIWGCGSSTNTTWSAPLEVTAEDVPPVSASPSSFAHEIDDPSLACCDWGGGCWVVESNHFVALDLELTFAEEAPAWQAMRVEGVADGVPATNNTPEPLYPQDTNGVAFSLHFANTDATRYCARVFTVDLRDGSETEDTPVCVMAADVVRTSVSQPEPALTCDEWDMMDGDDVADGPDGDFVSDGSDMWIGDAGTGSDVRSRTDGGTAGGTAGGSQGGPQDGANNGEDCGCSSVRGTRGDVPLAPVLASLGLLGLVAVRRRRH